MGHADVLTTMRQLHFGGRPEDAQRAQETRIG
jgi:hypothetical protein